jgi:hypothetical protein
VTSTFAAVALLNEVGPDLRQATLFAIGEWFEGTSDPRPDLSAAARPRSAEAGRTRPRVLVLGGRSWNEHAATFTWTKTAEQTLAKVRPARAALTQISP